MYQSHRSPHPHRGCHTYLGIILARTACSRSRSQGLNLQYAAKQDNRGELQPLGHPCHFIVKEGWQLVVLCGLSQTQCLYPSRCLPIAPGRGISQVYYFATMDLACGYWQVPIKEQNQEKNNFYNTTGTLGIQLHVV